MLSFTYLDGYSIGGVIGEGADKTGKVDFLFHLGYDIMRGVIFHGSFLLIWCIMHLFLSMFEDI